MNLQSISAAEVQIEWTEGDDGRIKELIVYNPAMASTRQLDSFGRRFESSQGVCSTRWLQDARSTPEAVFLTLIQAGFDDEIYLLDALDQFGKIEEASWARTMAESIREKLRSECDDEERLAELVAPIYGADHTGAAGKPYYVGHQWKVDGDGIDTISGSYFIEAERLGELYYPDPISSWPPHLSEKNWVDMKDFEAAFRVALEVHAGRYTPLPSGALERGLELAARP